MDKKIGQLIMFIDREAAEKVAEIEATTDDEFYDTVYHLVNNEKKKIRQMYEKQEKAVLKSNILTKATVKNGARLHLSRLKNDIVEDIFATAEDRMRDSITQNSRQYRAVMKQIVLQSLAKLLEPRVLVRVRKSDLSLMKAMVEEVRRDFEAMSLMQVNIRVDAKYFLPDTDIGGVMIYSTTGQMKVTNTLKFRIDLIREKMLPIVRHSLFGSNPSRKFFD